MFQVDILLSDSTYNMDCGDCDNCALVDWICTSSFVTDAFFLAPTVLYLIAYPFQPPKVKFDTKVYHPNVSSQTVSNPSFVFYNRDHGIAYGWMLRVSLGSG